MTQPNPRQPASCAHCHQPISGPGIREWTGPAGVLYRTWHADRPECSEAALPDAARRHTADTITDDELDQLYGWLDTARAVARAEQRRAERAEAVIRSALPVLKHAIDCLDVTCRYHGDQLDPDHHGQRYGREACCDTGVEPRRAREARQTLDRLRAALDEHQEQ